jgi:hypothetical protein
MSVKWKMEGRVAPQMMRNGQRLTTESLLAKSPSGFFRFWEGEAGRAVFAIRS